MAVLSERFVIMWPATNPLPTSVTTTTEIEESNHVLQFLWVVYETNIPEYNRVIFVGAVGRIYTDASVSESSEHFLLIVRLNDETEIVLLEFFK